MSLDDAIAAEEARLAAEAEAAVENLRRLDAAFHRFAELAPGRGLPPKDQTYVDGWMLKLPLAENLPPVYLVLIAEDGTWLPWHDAVRIEKKVAKQLRRAVEKSREHATPLRAGVVEAELARILVSGKTK